MAIEQNQKQQPGNPGPPLKSGLIFVLLPASSKTLPLAIANSGDTDVDWKADVGGAKWLTLDRYDGHIIAHEVQTIAVTANSRSLQVNDSRNATVTLTPQGQGIEPTTIAVELEISLRAYDDLGPHLAIVDPIETQPQQGQQNAINTRSWRITNPTSNGTVTWTINAGGVDWVTKINPFEGTLEKGEQVTIEVTTDTTKVPVDGKYRTDLVVTFTFEPNDEKREPTSAIIPLTVTVP